MTRTTHTHPDGRKQAVERDKLGRFTHAGRPPRDVAHPRKRTRAFVNRQAAGLASRGRPTSDDRDRARADQHRDAWQGPLRIKETES